MQVNNTDVVNRHNRPGTLQRVLLRTLFTNNGVFFDPVTVSSVTVFAKAQNTSPSSLIGSDGLLSDSAASSALMRFSPSGSVEDESLYVPGQDNVSSIFKLGTGDYAVILDGVDSISGVTRGGSAIPNTASGAKAYLDIWTVQLVAGSDFQTFINDFTLHSDSFTILTERLLLTTTNRLRNKQIVLGSTEDIKISTEVTIDNKTLDLATKNIFRETIVTSAMVEIKKINDSDNNLPAWTTVSAFGDTSSTVEVTEGNTILWTFDTNVLTSGLITDLGSGRGTYAVQVRYTLLAETIYSPLMYLKII